MKTWNQEMLAHQKIPNPQSLSFWQSLTNFVKDKCFAFLKIEVKICTFCWLEIKEEDQEKISQQEDTQRRTKGSCFENPLKILHIPFTFDHQFSVYVDADG